jgi:long-chain acyl-CoA synthetase
VRSPKVRVAGPHDRSGPARLAGAALLIGAIVFPVRNGPAQEKGRIILRGMLPDTQGCGPHGRRAIRRDNCGTDPELRSATAMTSSDAQAQDSPVPADSPWLKNYEPGLPRTLRPYPQRTLLDVMGDSVRERPGHTALIFKGTRLSYARLEQETNAFAAALAAQGVKRGDRVALLLPNSPQSVIAQLGVWKAGAIAVPINPIYTPRELEEALNEVGAETVVVLTPFYDKVKALQTLLPVRRVIATNIKEYLPSHMRLLFTVAREKKGGYRIRLQAGDLWWQDLVRLHAASPRPEIAPAPGDPAILLFSGGTTGTPKAALGTHHALLMSAMQLHAYANTVLADWDDTVTLVMPMFHVYGNMGMNTALVARWPMALVPNPRDINDLIATIAHVRPAVLHGVPTLFLALLNHPKVKAGRVDFTSLKVCYSGAAPLLADTKQRFEALTGGRLLEAYGMTETMLAAVVCPVHGAYKEGSTGIPLPDVDVQIVDIETGERLLPPGERGEVRIRAPQTMMGYWNRPGETAEMIRDGWVYTGDLGAMDEDGYLFIVDRKKDLIKPAGFQVWPREVEEVIATHHAVAEVSVAGVSDPYQGEAVKAWVVVREGQQVTADELRAYCRQRLIGYKVPAKIEFRAALPKTMVGKVLRRELAAQETG